MEAQVGRERLPMTQTGGGWWQVDVPSAGAGTDYRFALDGGEPLPDPRSAWQPHGVFGPSRVVDHGAFRWADQAWQAPPLSSAVIYELHVGTFTPEGTFDSAISRLDHLVDLGISHVELMPVNEFPGVRGWGYDGVDLYAPHHAYGGPDGLKRLVDACHARGLAILLDVVYNHLGPSGNYLGRFGPYFTERYTTPWGQAINLDGPESDEVRRFICNNALMWLRDYHCDGLRLDAVHAIVDTSALHLLEQLAVEVEALQAHLGRRLVVIAESDLNDPRLVRSREAGGYGLDAQWSDDFHHALHSVLTGERSGYYADFGTLADLAHALAHAYVYDGRYSRFRRRHHGRPAPGFSGARFLGYLQNHDQIGNRARGERCAALMSTGRLKIGAALVLTAPFVPMLFQGEEWGASTPFQYFTDHEDTALGQQVSEGRRNEFAAFGWDPTEVPDPQDPATFQRSKLDWSEMEREPHASLLDWHRRLIALRHSLPPLTDGRLDRVHVRYDEQARWLVMQRGLVAVACNLAERTQRVPLPKGAGRQVLLASAPGAKLAEDGVEIAGDGVVVVG
jgi:maltooligosyltrehalose trehalohydrolase